jgi:transposase
LLPLELLGAPEASRLVRACLDVERLTVHLAIAAPTAACPVCGSDARRVRSRYTRRLEDLPCLGRRVRLRVAVRRFVCPRSDCPRRIFAERLPGFAAPRARTTDRLCQTQTDIGSSLGGEAGSRLASRMGMATSPDTLLRRVKRLKNEPPGPPRVVGIDDWAWRKGQRYGTIVVDLERSDVIDLLPDRGADTVAAWLAAHPGVEVVSRDRSAAYAQAATEGAPQAGQVADRWHLLKNLREAVEQVLERHSAAINAAIRPWKLHRGRTAIRQPPRPAQRCRLPNRPYPGHRSSRSRHRHDSRPGGRDGGSWPSGSIGSTNSISEATRPPGSPANWACHGGPCSDTCGVRRAPPGISGGRNDRGWTGTGSGSTPGSPRAPSTLPTCTGS